MCQLIQHTCLGQRKATVVQVLAQRADGRCVEAAEPPNRGNALGKRIVLGHYLTKSDNYMRLSSIDHFRPCASAGARIGRIKIVFSRMYGKRHDPLTLIHSNKYQRLVKSSGNIGPIWTLLPRQCHWCPMQVSPAQYYIVGDTLNR